MSDTDERHTPPADAVEAITEALWRGSDGTFVVLSHRRIDRAIAEALSAAHAAGTIRWESEYREAVALLRDAVENEGPVPAHHRKVMARHRAEWPTLWAAIDRLLARIEGSSE